MVSVGIGWDTSETRPGHLWGGTLCGDRVRQLSETWTSIHQVLKIRTEKDTFLKNNCLFCFFIISYTGDGSWYKRSTLIYVLVCRGYLSRIVCVRRSWLVSEDLQSWCPGDPKLIWKMECERGTPALSNSDCWTLSAGRKCKYVLIVIYVSKAGSRKETHQEISRDKHVYTICIIHLQYDICVYSHV